MVVIALLLAFIPIHLRSLPVIRPVSGLVVRAVDQESTYVQVENTRPGARVDAYANGFHVGSAFAAGPVTRVPLLYPLTPGMRIAVSVRIGSGVAWAQNNINVNNDFLTYHYNARRTGWNRFETTLNATNVASSSFGLLFNFGLDADMLAEPLYVQNVAIPGMGTHNVLYAATENDSLYAIDADSGAALWVKSFVNPGAGITPIPDADVNSCKNIAPNIGITSTPVIVAATNTMYLVTAVKIVSGGVPSWHQFLHAVDITTGQDKPGSPVDLRATVGIGGGQTVSLDPRWALNRPGLLELDGNVYVAFGSHCDYMGLNAHGWILSYDESTLQQRFVYTSSPNQTEGFGSLWMGGFGLATDYLGSVFAVTGNGAFDADTGGADFGNSILKLSKYLRVTDYFTPYNQQLLDTGDKDLGSGGIMVLPPQLGAYPHMAVVAGKARTLYLVNTDALGRYTPNGPDNVIQEIPAAVGAKFGVWGGPGYYLSPTGTPYVYFCGGHDHIKAFALQTSPSTQLSLAMETANVFVGEGGTIPAVSSNGQTPGTGVLWAVGRPPATTLNISLFAYDSTNLSHMLFSTVVGTFDNPNGGYFAVPTVINGRVYVGTGRGVAAYGLR